MTDSEKLLDYLEDKINEIMRTIECSVKLESPSHQDKKASDKCSMFFQKLLADTGFKVNVIPQTENGNHIIAELGAGRRGTLCIGHYDTVFPIGGLEENPFRVNEGKAYGPGILDMKGGIVMGVFAVRALKELNMLPEDKKIAFFLNGDEESGSFNSSEAILKEAEKYDNVIVLEPGYDEIGSIKRSRYGRGTYKIIAHGKSAHSGSNPDEGINPIREISYQIQKVIELNDKKRGISLVPTWFSGGISGTCMIPKTASVSFDVRTETAEISKEIDCKIKELKPFMNGIRLEIEGGIDKPPLPEYRELIDKASAYASELGIKLKPEKCMGGSDGNFTGGAGIPTIDGMGMSGLYLHTPDEYINVNHIAKRTALVAQLIRNL